MNKLPQSGATCLRLHRVSDEMFPIASETLPSARNSDTSPAHIQTVCSSLKSCSAHMIVGFLRMFSCCIVLYQGYSSYQVNEDKGALDGGHVLYSWQAVC